MSTRNLNARRAEDPRTNQNHNHDREVAEETNQDTDIIELNEPDDQSNVNSDTDSPDIGVDDYDFKQNKITRFNSIIDPNKDDDKNDKVDEGEGEVSRRPMLAALDLYFSLP
jgi:hypothetical protein